MESAGGCSAPPGIPDEDDGGEPGVPSDDPGVAVGVEPGAEPIGDGAELWGGHRSTKGR